MEPMPAPATTASTSEEMPISEDARRTNLYKMSAKDEILPVFRIGQRVRLIKAIRNDGTYPYAAPGEFLVDAGAEGYVRKIGDFLQTIRIYEVNFFEEGVIFGCREAELEAAEEEDGYDEVPKSWHGSNATVPNAPRPMPRNLRKRGSSIALFLGLGESGNRFRTVCPQGLILNDPFV